MTTKKTAALSTLATDHHEQRAHRGLRHRLGRLSMVCALATTGAPATMAADLWVNAYITSFQSPILAAPDNPMNTSFNLIDGYWRPGYNPWTGESFPEWVETVTPLQPAPAPNPPRPMTDFAGGGLGYGARSYVQSSTVNFDAVSNINFGVRGNFMPTVDNGVALVSNYTTSVNYGQDVPLVDISFTNGDWMGEATIGIRLVTYSSDPRFDGQVIDETIKLGITSVPRSATPEQGADFLYIADRPDLGSIRVYEQHNSPTGSNNGIFTLYGSFVEPAVSNRALRYSNSDASSVSQLNLTRFGLSWYAERSPQYYGGFLDPSIDTGYTPPVPEPGAAWLLASGLVWLACRRRSATATA